MSRYISVMEEFSFLHLFTKVVAINVLQLYINNFNLLHTLHASGLKLLVLDMYTSRKMFVFLEQFSCV